MPKTRAVGIDLGTTYCATAWIDDAGRSAIITNAEGEVLTPSVVLFEDKEVVVGRDAKKVGMAEADRVAICAKRDMGKPVFSRPIRGQYLPPEVIQSYILRKLRRDITRKIGPDFQTVLTVPAYFDEPRRKATFHAGVVAGLNVLDILNEPTAGALAFGEEQDYLTRFGAPKERMRFIVYDLGGGTFDVTLIDMRPGDLRTICTDGDMILGGHDWDMRLADFAAEAFLKEFGEDPRKLPASMQRLLVAAEEAKHTLSQRERTKVFVTHMGRAMEVPVTREQFEELTADLLDRTRYTTRRLLSAAGLEWNQIDRVLLTGGSTRMPMVQRMLTELTGLELDQSISPDEAVARGAAIYAQYLLASQGEGHKPSFDVTNVNAHSLGIRGTDPETNSRRNRILIPRNTPLPAKKSASCATKQDDQHSVVIDVLEGESLDPDQCSAIGRAVIQHLPPGLPKGWPIDVCYEYGVNGRLTVRALVRGTDKEISMELERDESMSIERLDRWKRVLESEGGLDAFERAVMEDLEELKKRGWSAANAATATSPIRADQGVTATSAQQAASRPVATTQGSTAAKPQATAAQAKADSDASQEPAEPTSGFVSRAFSLLRRVFQRGEAASDDSTPLATGSSAPGAPAKLVAFACPYCRGVFHLPESLAGQRAHCPGCCREIIVPNVDRQT